MQKIHCLSEDEKQDPKLEKLKIILSELIDYTFLKIYEVQELKIEYEDCQQLLMNDILTTVFGNVISISIGRMLMEFEPNIKLAIKYFEEVTEQIHCGSNKLFLHFVERHSIDKKEIH